MSEGEHAVGKQGSDCNWGTGIRRAISLALAQAGAAATINYLHNEVAAQDTLQQIMQANGKAQIVQGDVSCVEDIQRLIARTVQTYGRLDVIINNAGVETRTSILDSSEQQFEQAINVNLKGAFLGTQYAAKQMIAQGGGGRIITITSLHDATRQSGCRVSLLEVVIQR